MANEYTRILSHPLHIIAFIDSSNLNNTCQHEINQKLLFTHLEGYLLHADSLPSLVTTRTLAQPAMGGWFGLFSSFLPDD